ncbi:MAG: hypothetical protein WDW38_004448 [Sanguina aurantia]
MSRGAVPRMTRVQKAGEPGVRAVSLVRPGLGRRVEEAGAQGCGASYDPGSEGGEQVVDEVTLGMGGAVIDADSIFVPPSKMTLVELRVELEEAGTDTTDFKRPALTKAVKDRRKLLPSHVLAFQARAEQARDGEAENAKPDKSKNTKIKSSSSAVTGWAVHWLSTCITSGRV